MRHYGFALCLVLTLPLLCGAGQAASAAPAATAVRVRELRSKGLDLLYNLDYRQSLATFEQAIAIEPRNPALHRLAASVIWMGILFDWGAVLVDDYLGQAKELVERQPPPPGTDRSFQEHINRSLELARHQLGQRRDPDALYQVGAGEGFLASYIATVQGRLLGGVEHARLAFRMHERALEIDPLRKDAALVPGIYRYSLASMSLPVRLMAKLAGIDSGRDEGIRQVEEAAGYPSDAQTDAMFILILIYNREERYDDALRVIRNLQGKYPRNRLLWLESGTTALRAGRAVTARAELERGLAIMAGDSRPRAFGETARWLLAYGTALASLNPDEAVRQFRAALMAPSPDWVRGRTYNELGKLADRRGDRDDALREYLMAVRLCRAGNDRVCAEDANQLIRNGTPDVPGSVKSTPGPP